MKLSQRGECTESERYLQISDFGLHTSTASLIGAQGLAVIFVQ
jgi:hypothetical protein